MILFRACPRCRGDVDTTYSDDIYCVQCGHRPEVCYPGPRIVQRVGPDGVDATDQGATAVARWAFAAAGGRDGAGVAMCPRCGSAEALPLDRLREQDNRCYRCRGCGHIFSPAVAGGGERRAQAR